MSGECDICGRSANDCDCDSWATKSPMTDGANREGSVKLSMCCLAPIKHYLLDMDGRPRCTRCGKSNPATQTLRVVDIDVCAYCETPLHPASVDEHIASCTKHPVFKLTKQLAERDAEVERMKQELESAMQSIGLLVTCKPTMAMRADDLIGMAKEVVAEVASLRAKAQLLARGYLAAKATIDLNTHKMRGLEITSEWSDFEIEHDIEANRIASAIAAGKEGA